MIVAILIVLVLPSAASGEPSLHGQWETDYGDLLFTQRDAQVTGSYQVDGHRASLSGRLKGDVLHFRFLESESEGQGELLFSPDRRSFRGRWREEGGATWTSWDGARADQRLPDRPETVTLVVLEGYWDDALSSSEPSLGRLVEAYFSAYDGVEVRHRHVAGQDDLTKWIREAALMPGPVVLVIAAHGSVSGLEIGKQTIDARALARPLAAAKNIRLLHLSACETMQGAFSSKLLRSLGLRTRLAVSGYARAVDWNTSALVDLAYLDLVVSAGLTPELAVRQVMKLFPFAGGTSPRPMTYEALGLRVRSPSSPGGD